MENQRIRLSKTMLKNALMSLLRKKPIEKITIYELCDEAQINRTTFYKYYYTQYDLLSDIENDYFMKFEDMLRDKNVEDSDNLYQILNILLSDKENFTILINTVPDKEFSDKLFSLPAIRTQLDMKMPQGLSEKEKEYFRLFFCQGGYALIKQWLNNENQESPKEISDLLFFIIAKITN